jgi:hypothetical protein
VIFPGWLIEELSPDEVNQILLHELAHLRRRDDWTNLVEKLVKAMLFFHPAVWWIESKVSLEREMACDDAVLAETARPRAYAECLTHVAEKTLIRRSLVLAQAALGRVRQTSLRVARILDANRPRQTGHAWRSAVPLLAGFAITCTLLVSNQRQLIAFQDAGPNAPSPVIAASSSLGIPPTPAIFRTAGVPTSRRIFREHARRVALASKKISSKAAHGGFENFEATFVVEDSTVESNLLYTTVLNSPSLISTETVYLLTEESGGHTSRRTLCEIQVCMKVFRPATRSVSIEPPRTET